MTGRRTVRVVLQSRLSSSRLPGKAMLTVAGRPMVVLAAQRAANSGLEVVVATSDRPEDDVIAAAVSAAGIGVVRGPLDDPLARFVIAASGLSDDDVVVRLTADNVVPDGELINFLVAGLGSGAYARFGGDDPAVPYGVAGEAFTVAAVREADANATAARDREHVTPLIRMSYGDRRLALPELKAGWGGLRCTVDTFDDYVAISRVFAEVDPLTASWRTLCDTIAASAPAAATWPIRHDNVLGQGPLVLGTVQLGVAYGAANATGLPDLTTSAAVLAEATAQRISHLDTARAYGASEQRIGAALSRGLSERVGVVTKIAPLDEITTESWGRDAVLASANASLLALQTKSVAALLTHRAADWHRPGVRAALIALRQEGVAQVIGASLSTPAELLELLRDDELGYVQLPFNLLDRRWLADDVQAAFEARADVIVTTRSAYLQGLLVSPTAAWPTNDGIVPVDVMPLVAELGRSSAADLCLAYVLGHSWVTSVVVGAEAPGQVADSAALARQTPLTNDEIARVQVALPRGSADLLDPSRWRTS